MTDKPGYEKMFNYVETIGPDGTVIVTDAVRRVMDEEIYEVAQQLPFRFWDAYKGSGFLGHYREDEIVVGMASPPRKFPTANHLLIACYQWLVWMEQHPLYAEKQFPYMGVVTVHQEARRRVLTLVSLWNFLKMNRHSWSERMPGYKEDGEDYKAVVLHIEMLIYQDKFEGVNAGFYNPNVISNDLGLTTRIHQESGDKNGPEKLALTDEQLKKELLDRGLSPTILLGRDQFHEVEPEETEREEDIDA